jgi:hypothetical protein
MSDEDRPDAAFHEKKAKNKKTTNYGGGQKLKMKKALKHMKPLTVLSLLKCPRVTK